MNRKFRLILGIALLTLVSATVAQDKNNTKSAPDSSRFRSNYPFVSTRPTLDSPSPLSDFHGSRGQSDRGLPLFGQDLFVHADAELQEDKAEVFLMPPDYKLGPGDKIGIFLLGNVQENLNVTVNVEGKIFVPPAGVIDVWGLRISEFRTLLAKKLTNYYDNFTLDLMLLRPKNVMVAVVGEVQRPGKYALSAMNTVLDAVVLAGGPNSRGSLRDIQLIRNDSLTASVDLYQFLINGSSDFDKFLETGDRVNVPLANHIVTIDGEIKRPSTFELKPQLNEKLTDLLELAGGLTEYAYGKKIEISRLQNDGRRQLDYVNYYEIMRGDSTQNLQLQNADYIHVYSKLEQIHDRKVFIFGEIRRPGEYTLEENMHLSDLVLKAGSLTRKAYTLQAEVAKVDPGEPTTFLKVALLNLTDGTNGHNDILLEEDDQVFIRQIPEWEVGLTVEVQGEVMFPGKYSIVKDSTHLSEILIKTGGFTEEAFLEKTVLLRPSSRVKFDKEFERLTEMRREEMTDLEYQYFVMRQNTSDVNEIVVDFEKLMKGHDLSHDIILEDGDIIRVPKAPKVVSVTGRVARPGGVTFSAAANLSYYLAKAGGASWDANLRKTKVIKISGEVLDDEDVKAFEPGDIIWVPRKSDKNFWPIFLQTVSVTAQLASIFLIIDTALNR